MQMIDLIAGLAWDPEIRGFLAVLTGIVVLMGSVWLILSTNSGTRLGTLIAGAGFFGWMAIMGSIWWIYGIGYAGDRPVFEEVEIAEGDLGGADLEFAALDRAQALQSEALPIPYELLIEEHADAISTYGEGVFGPNWEELVPPADHDYIEQLRVAWADFGVVTRDTLTADQIEGLTDAEIDALVAEEDARNQATTLSELASEAPALIPEELPQLGEWRLLSTADMGEAQASAIAFLLESGDYDFDNQTQFKILNGYASGGKDGLPENPSRWDRIYTQIKSALTIKHPTGYALIQVQAVTAESLDNLPGTAPKRPVLDENEPVVSVVLIRNLGNLRQLPAMVTLGSLLIFLAFVYMLHERDKVAMARAAQAGAS
jgi:hypothetical protein